MPDVVPDTVAVTDPDDASGLLTVPAALGVGDAGPITLHVSDAVFATVSVVDAELLAFVVIVAVLGDVNVTEAVSVGVPFAVVPTLPIGDAVDASLPLSFTEAVADALQVWTLVLHCFIKYSLFWSPYWHLCRVLCLVVARDMMKWVTSRLVWCVAEL